MPPMESGCSGWKASQATASKSTSFSDLLLDIVMTVGLRLWFWGFKGLLLLTMQSEGDSDKFCLTCSSRELHRHYAEMLCRPAADLPAQEN